MVPLFAEPSRYYSFGAPLRKHNIKKKGPPEPPAGAKKLNGLTGGPHALNHVSLKIAVHGAQNHHFFLALRATYQENNLCLRASSPARGGPRVEGKVSASLGLRKTARAAWRAKKVELPLVLCFLNGAPTL